MNVFDKINKQPEEMKKRIKDLIVKYLFSLYFFIIKIHNKYCKFTFLRIFKHNKIRYTKFRDPLSLSMFNYRFNKKLY